MQWNDFSEPVVCQIGLVVRDIAAAAKAYAAVFGLKTPEVIVTDTAEKAHTQFRGQATPGRAKLAFFQFANVVVELIEPMGGPSTWREFLDTHGEGVHHLAFRVRGMEKALAHLEGQGVAPLQRGDYTGGRYAYLGSDDQLKVVLELLESLPAGQAPAPSKTPRPGG